ncbi:hypothetical protein P691DRAFT_764001 [Macrolepiota fuliginosa MF-IS2]|uniref:RING-type domain-containing protein n=1 Tax=Macrolepiota fuliginosa MF-IS2 TaxID=1400762 RepID=A0A9P6BX78_9AGAR|nr:hypothetical protein P691DRAFT_764001 [Macrolepiota fuliginosa MF-IS2]
MQDADVIEISSQASSSPPLEPLKPRTRQATRIANGRFKGKGKMKDVEVIELTDGDDDLEGILCTSYKKPIASPSARKKRKVIVVDSDSDSDSDYDGAAPKAGPSRVRGVSRPSSSKLGVPNGTRSASTRSNIPHENRVAGLVTDPETGDSEVSHAVNDKGKAKDDGSAATGGHRMEMGRSDEENGPLPQRSPAVPGPSGLNSSPHGLLSPSRSVAPMGGSLSPVPAPTTSSPLPVPQPMSQQQPVPPPPLEETPEQLQSRFTAQILEIIPDVDPVHVSSLVTDHFPQLKDATIERVLHILFEDPTYPRVQKDVKGKRKAADDEGERPKKRTRKEREKEKEKENELWKNIERPFVGGKDYHDLALNQLQTDYPHIPKAYLLSQLTTRHKGFYAPTFFFLRQLERQLEGSGGALVSVDGVVYHEPPYEPLKTLHKPSDPRRKGKGKQKALEDREFDRELKWVQRMIAIEEGREVEDDENEGVAEEADDKDNDEGKEEINEEEEEAEESDGEDEEKGIECGCCFSKFRFEKLVQCPDAHLFCRSCVRGYAATQLGSHNPHIPCMAQSACTQSFPPSVLRTALPRKLYALYERLVQAKEIAAAGLDNLEECPFCEYKAVFDVGFEEEKLFKCGGCASVSCRKCKKVDHLPKRCEEVEEDKKLDARHLVEEAMTQALMRNCPKCKKAFIKESGCNKMACPNCRTLSCYICRKVIVGYDHFNQNPGRAGTSSDAGKCVLWDKDLDAMHASEVKKAADKAIAEAQLLHPDVLVSDLKVGAPKAKKSKKAQQQQLHPPVPRGVHMPLPPPLPAPRRQHRGRGRAQAQRLPEMDFNFRFNLNLGDAAPGPAPPQGDRHFGHDLRHLRQPQPQPLPPPLHHPQHQGVPVVQRGGVQRPFPYEQQQPPPPQPPVQPYQRAPIDRAHAQMQQRGIPQGPPIAPPPLQQAPPPYHEAVAQAMRGDYQPVGGGVEVGGMMLRARPGRGVAPGVGVDGGGGGGVVAGGGHAYPEYRREAIGNVYGDIGRMMLERERERVREREIQAGIQREGERRRLLQRQQQIRQEDHLGLWLNYRPPPQQQQQQPRVEAPQEIGVRALMAQRLAQAEAQAAARTQHNQEQVGRKRKTRHAT